MAANYLYRIKILLKRLLPLYLIYFLCRILFYFFNRNIFSSVSFGDLIKDCYYGLRFDTFSICAASSFFILFSLLPVKNYYSKGYQNFLKLGFLIPNSFFILFNCIDFAYFPFIKKRSSADLFKQIGGQTDLGHLLPQYIKDFWWVLVIFILLMILITKIYKRVRIKEHSRGSSDIATPWPKAVVAVVLMLGFTFLGIRGGISRTPIDIIDAGAHTSPEEVPIVLNTPFTLIKSLGKQELKEYHFYTGEELKKIFNPVHHYDTLQFKKRNVVILILESFAKEYTALGKTGVSYTPFLDSLTGESFVFTNGFGNGSKSIEGIPAILSSLPHLMENPFINSTYSNNFQTTFATLLNAEGYTTAFFHGGINGTMNFDVYSRLAGYKFYFGKNEYDNDADFDGFWGIWDEPFLQYSVKKMSEFKEPFHTSVFTLSSHHPYFIPKKYEGKFPKGTLDNSASIGYGDYALKQFFHSAKKTTWFKNTLFVLCADHTSLSDHPFYKNIVGQQCIPILFYSPQDSLKGSYNSSFSQIDILPSVMNLLGYNKPFFAFGQSYLDPKNNNCYYYINGDHLLIADTIMATFNNNSIKSLYNFKSDSTLNKPLLNKYPTLEAKMTKEFKAFMQTHNAALISNSGREK